jgi:hypothetical protein
MVQKIREGVFSDWASEYEIPSWYKSIQDGCETDPAKTNQLSQHLLGIDACDQNRAIDYERTCVEEPIDESKQYCFLSKRSNPLIHPLPYLGVLGSEGIDEKEKEKEKENVVPPVKGGKYTRNPKRTGLKKRKHTRRSWDRQKI